MGSMTTASADLHRALLAAFVPYVDEAVARQRLGDTEGLGDAVESGRSWLDGALRDLLSLEPGAQRRSPLELFQEALRFPTEALQAAGVAPAERDPVAAAALPGDVYDLAPASSRVLGEEAWRAHVAWGIAKAEVVAGARPAEPAPDGAGARPVVGLVSADLMDRSKVEPIVRAAGLGFEVWRNPGAVSAGLDRGSPAVVLVDLTHPAADDAIRSAAARGVKVVAFGPHVDDVAMARARSLGAADAIARSRFFRALPDLLPRLA
jgi:hypothetical protein